MNAEQLFSENQWLIKLSLKKLFGPKNSQINVAMNNHMCLEDLIQVGRIALWKAATKYNSELGYAFSSYAVATIRGAILHELRRKGPMIHIPHARDLKTEFKPVDSLNIRIEGADEGDSELIELIPSYDSSFDLSANMEALERLFSVLDDNEKFIVRQALSGESQSSTGKALGISQMHVSRRLKKAIAKMSNEYQAGVS